MADMMIEQIKEALDETYRMTGKKAARILCGYAALDAIHDQMWKLGYDANHGLYGVLPEMDPDAPRDYWRVVSQPEWERLNAPPPCPRCGATDHESITVMGIKISGCPEVGKGYAVVDMASLTKDPGSTSYSYLPVGPTQTFTFPSASLPEYRQIDLLCSHPVVNGTFTVPADPVDWPRVGDAGNINLGWSGDDPLYDGLTAAQCFVRFQTQQARDCDLELTPLQIQAARTEWSRQLREKQAEAREKERRQVTVEWDE